MILTFSSLAFIVVWFFFPEGKMREHCLIKHNLKIYHFWSLYNPIFFFSLCSYILKNSNQHTHSSTDQRVCLTPFSLHGLYNTVGQTFRSIQLAFRHQHKFPDYTRIRPGLLDEHWHQVLEKMKTRKG